MKVNARISFYDFKPLQKVWWYYLIRLLSWSRHTHAHLEFDLGKPFAFIITPSDVRAVKLGLLLQTGVTKYYDFSLGQIDMNEKDLIKIQEFPSATPWKMIAYQAGGRFFGMKRPVSCVTFICDYLRYKGWDTPSLFTPQELWESLHASNNVKWSGPCR